MDYSKLPAMLDTEQAAEILNVHRRSVIRMCVGGDIKAIKIRGLWRVNRDDLLEQLGLVKAERDASDEDAA